MLFDIQIISRPASLSERRIPSKSRRGSFWIAGIGSLFLSTTLSVHGPAVAQSLANPARTYDRSQGQLSNGLRYLIERRPGAPIVARLGVAVGEAAEVPGVPVAHLIEHRGLRETRHYPDGSLYRTVKYRFGGRWEAVTTPYYTRYSLILPADTEATVDEMAVVLRDWADGIVLTKANVDQERNVILAETANATTLNMPEILVTDIIFGSNKGEMANSRVRNLSSFPYSEAKTFYDHWYRPSLMTVVVVGDVDVSKWTAAIEKDFSSLKNPLHPAITPKPEAKELPKSDRVFFIEDASKSHFVVQTMLASPDVFSDWTGANQRNTIVRSLAINILSDRALRNMEKSGGIDMNVADGDNIAVGKQNILSLTSAAEKGDFRKAIEDHAKFLKQINNFPILEAELEEAKSKLKGKTLSMPAGSDVISNWYSDSFLSNENFEVALTDREKLDIIDAVGINEVSKQILILISGEPRTAVLYPPGKLDSTALSEIARGDLSATLNSSSAPPPPPMPLARTEVTQKFQETDRAPRPKLQAILTHQFRLPGGMVLTMADPSEVAYGGPELRILGPVPEAFGAEGREFKLTPPTSKAFGGSIGEASFPLVTDMTFEVSGSLGILALRGRPGSDGELFRAARDLLKHPASIDKWRAGEAGATDGNSVPSNKISELIASWHPQRMAFVGAATAQEVERFAWNNFVSSDAGGAHCAVNAQHGRPVYEIENTTRNGITDVTLTLRLSKASASSACFEILQDILQERVTRIIRNEKGLAYSPRVQMMSEDSGDIREIRFVLAPSGRPSGRPEIDRVYYTKNYEAWRGIIADFKKNGIDDQEFYDSKLSVMKKKLIKPYSNSDLISLLDGEKYEKGVEASQIEKIKIQDFLDMIGKFRS